MVKVGSEQIAVRTADDAVAGLRLIVKQLRRCEVRRGPKIMQVDQLPTDDCPIEELVTWMAAYAMKANLTLATATKHKHMIFTGGSEKAIKKLKTEAGQTETMSKKEKVKPKSELDRLCNEQRRRIAELHDCLERAANIADQSATEIKNMKEELNYREKILKDFEDNYTAIPDPVPAGNEGAGSGNGDNPDKDANSKPDGSTDPKDFNNGPTDDTEPEDLSPEDEKLTKPGDVDAGVGQSGEGRNKKNHRRKNAGRRRAKVTSAPAVGTTFGPDVIIAPLKVTKVWVPGEDRFETIYNLEAKIRINEILHNLIDTMQDIKAMSFTMRVKSGVIEFSRSAASCTEVAVYDAAGNLIKKLNAALLLNPDTPDREKLKDKLCDDEHFQDALRDILREYNGALMISPTEHLGLPSQILGRRPLYVKSGVSEEYAIKLITDFILLHTSKSRLIDQANKISNYDNFSKPHLITLMNAMARIYMELAGLHRRLIFKHDRVLMNDETGFCCLEWLKPDKDGKKKQHNEFWGMVSGKREPLQGVIYLAGKGRSTADFLQQFGYIEGKSEKLRPGDFAVEAFVTDGYGAYNKGIESLEEMLGRLIKRCLCYAHLRRKIIDALRLMGVDEIFEKICTCPPNDFSVTLNKELKDRGLKIGKVCRKMLFLGFLVELILRMDSNAHMSIRILMCIVFLCPHHSGWYLISIS